MDEIKEVVRTILDGYGRHSDYISYNLTGLFLFHHASLEVRESSWPTLIVETERIRDACIPRPTIPASLARKLLKNLEFFGSYFEACEEPLSMVEITTDWRIKHNLTVRGSVIEHYYSWLRRN